MQQLQRGQTETEYLVMMGKNVQDQILVKMDNAEASVLNAILYANTVMEAVVV